MNSCNFIGRIGKDAVTRFTQAGKAVTGWPLAVDVGFGEDKKTLWIDCNMWGERGQKVCEYIRKGDRIGVAGELGTREHDGKTYVTLNVRELTLLGNKQDKPDNSGAGSARAPQQAQQQQTDGFEDSEIPL
jgi:single-strand DNA-binding protein